MHRAVIKYFLPLSSCGFALKLHLKGTGRRIEPTDKYFQFSQQSREVNSLSITVAHFGILYALVNAMGSKGLLLNPMFDFCGVRLRI